MKIQFRILKHFTQRRDSLNLIKIIAKRINMLSHTVINIFLGNNIRMHNIHNYDNSKFKSNSLMFNYYVFKKEKVLNVFNQLSIWLSFQLSIIFLIGIPVTLSLWSIKKRNKAVNKLLSIYWKISLLFFISLLLLIGK